MSTVKSYSNQRTFFENDPISDLNILFQAYGASNTIVFSQSCIYYYAATTHSQTWVNKSLLVYRHIHFKYKGINYTSNTGMIQFIPESNDPNAYRRPNVCYLMLDSTSPSGKMQFQFDDQPGQLFNVVLHPHQLLSLLFVGVDLDPNIQLFVEVNEIGEVSAYYCTQEQYDLHQCSNQVELFITNILMTPVISSWMQGSSTPQSSQLGHILKEMVEEKDYSLQYTTQLQNLQDPALDRQPYNIDIIPALQCIGSQFAIQNMFTVDLFQILNFIHHSIKVFTQNLQIFEKDKNDLPIQTYYLNKTLNDEGDDLQEDVESYIKYLVSIYKKFGYGQMAEEIRENIKKLKNLTLYIDYIQKGLLVRQQDSDINIFNEIQIQNVDLNLKFNQFQMHSQNFYPIDQVNRGYREPADTKLKSPTIYQILIKGIWILFNKGYKTGINNTFSIKYILNYLSQTYKFDAFSAINIFITNELTNVNADKMFESVQSLASLPQELLNKPVEL